MAITFSVNQIVGESSFIDFQDFNALKNETDTKNEEIDGQDSKIVSIKRIEIDRYEDRFIAIYISNGARYPYSNLVVDENLEEIQNPRDVDMIEMDKQFFGLIDTINQTIYLSDQSKRKTIQNYLATKLGKIYIIKSVINEAEFFNKIKEISKISFTVKPDLLSYTNTLSESLTEDILGFGAEEAKLILSYSKSSLTDQIKQKIQDILSQKNNFKDLVVVGKDQAQKETILNFEGITNKIKLDIQASNETRLYNNKKVFESLVEYIKNNEN